MKTYSPLEQFEVFVLKPFNFFGVMDLSFSITSFFLLLVMVSCLFLLFTSIFNAKLIPTYWQSASELFYLFLLQMLQGQAGKKATVYFPFIFFLFMFILFSNLIGLFPFGFTVTAQIIVTFTLAFSINLGLIVLGFSRHGIAFLSIFVPKEAPAALLPLIVIIEVVSYLLRTFSLSIRLFANMMAGHTLLNILSSFVIAFINNGLWFLGILPFVLVMAVICLEFGIAFLQAYVFVILTCIYANDSLNLH